MPWRVFPLTVEFEMVAVTGADGSEVDVAQLGAERLHPLQQQVCF